MRAKPPILAIKKGVAEAFLRDLCPAPWTLAAGWRKREISSGAVEAGLAWAENIQARQGNVSLVLPTVAGRHWFLAVTAPGDVETSSLDTPPTQAVFGGTATLLWRLAEPVPADQAARASAALAARLRGASPLTTGAIPLAGTIEFVWRGARFHGRRAVTCLNALPWSYTLTAGKLARPAAKSDTSAAQLTQRADAIQAAPQRWLWPGVIPAGEFTLISGQPKVGKSTICQDIAARVSAGREWPTGEPCEAGVAIVMETEEMAATATKPRLMAMGADMKRISLRGREEGPVDLSQEIERVAAEAKRLGNVKLLVLSPVLSFFGRTVSDDTEVRRRLRPMEEWAARTGVAVIGIMHPPKRPGKALEGYFAGADTYRRAARAAWVVRKLEKGTGRELVCAGINGGADDLRLLYRIEGARAGGIETSRVVWMPGQAEAGEQEGEEAPKRRGRPATRAEDAMERPEARDAISWLRSALAAGPRQRIEVQREALAEGIGKGALDQAARAAGVLEGKDGGRVTWRLRDR